MVEEAVAVGGIYLEYDLIKSNKMGLLHSGSPLHIV